MTKKAELFYSCCVIALIALVIGACNDPTTIGAGIVDNDALPIKVAEYEASFTQVPEEPVLTYADGSLNLINQAQCGALHDATFGITRAGFYMQFIPAEIDFRPGDEAVIDSVKLVLYLDQASSYGPVEEVSIAIGRITEFIDGTQEYFSDATFAVGQILLSEHAFTPDYERVDSINEQGPTASIPLPVSIAEEVFQYDTTTVDSALLFAEKFGGFYIFPVGEYNHLMGIRPYISVAQTSSSAIRIHYRTNEMDTVPKIFRAAAFIGDRRTPVVQRYQYDYTDTKVQDALDQVSSDLFYIQGNGGVSVDMKFDNVSALGDVLVNKAELSIPLSNDNVDYANFNEMRTLLMTRKALNGSQVFVDEFLESGAFGFTPIGRLDTIENQPYYVFNIPIVTQQLVDGTVFDDAIRLQGTFVPTNEARRNNFGPLNMSESSARSAIFGQQIPSGAIRLKISYTENQ